MTQHSRAIIQDTAPAAIIERAALAAAVQTALMPVERRNSIPILGNLRLVASDGGGLLISGTDLDIDVSVTVPGAVDSRFDVTLPAHSLSDFLKKAKASEYVAMTAATDDGGNVDLDFEGLNISLQALPASDFPELVFAVAEKANDGTFPPKAWAYTLPAASLAMAIAKVEGCISTEETRYYLNGICLHDDADDLVFVATDGHRLSRYVIDMPDGCDGGIGDACNAYGTRGVIIPRKTIGIVGKMLKAELKAAGKAKVEAAPVTVEITKAACRFTIGSGVVTSKLIDGTFPDYERVIPTGNEKAMRLDRKALATGVEQVTVVSSERGRAVKIAMEPGKVRLTVNNPDAGSARLDVPATFYNADPNSNGGPLDDSDLIDIGLNASYLLDALGNIDSDEVEIRTMDPGSPVRFYDTEDSRLTYVLMPMRV